MHRLDHILKAYCDNCWADFDKTHFNHKYCQKCKRLGGYLTYEQEEIAKKYARKIPIQELAEKVGVSNSTIDRWSRRTGVSINWLKYDEKIIAKVCEYYFKHGKIKTQQKFPHVKLRSIVERYLTTPRQIRWKENEILELVKMGGILSMKDQALYFNRPGANSGSIVSAWMKKFGCSGGNINGLPYYIAKHYVKDSCPFLITPFWRTRKENQNYKERRIALWIDLEKHLNKEIPDELKLAIKALAKFQRWLHGRNVKANIERMIDERSH